MISSGVTLCMGECPRYYKSFDPVEYKSDGVTEKY